MGNPLRDRRTPSELAASGQVIEFDGKISDFERLAETLRADLATLDPATLPADWRDAPVSGQLAFGFADAQSRLPALDGAVVATIDAVCQRCLAPFRRTLEVPLRLVFGSGTTPASEQAGYELWELPGAYLRPLDIVDEALVMAMPFAAMHENDAACSAAATSVDDSADKTRPFADLRAQMDTGNQD